MSIVSTTNSQESKKDGLVSSDPSRAEQGPPVTSPASPAVGDEQLSTNRWPIAPKFDYRDALSILSEESHRNVEAGLLEVDAKYHAGFFFDSSGHVDYDAVYCAAFNVLAEEINKHSDLTDELLFDLLPRVAAEAVRDGQWNVYGITEPAEKLTDRFGKYYVTPREIDYVRHSLRSVFSTWMAKRIRQRSASSSGPMGQPENDTPHVMRDSDALALASFRDRNPVGNFPTWRLGAIGDGGVRSVAKKVLLLHAYVLENISKELGPEPDRYDWEACLRRAYDIVADELLKAGKLDETVLTTQIPAIVSDVSMSGQWLLSALHWYPRNASPKRPADGMWLEFGNYWLTPSGIERLQRTLMPRVVYWRAMLIGEPPAGETTDQNCPALQTPESAERAAGQDNSTREQRQYDALMAFAENVLHRKPSQQDFVEYAGYAYNSRGYVKQMLQGDQPSTKKLRLVLSRAPALFIEFLQKKYSSQEK